LSNQENWIEKWTIETKQWKRKQTDKGKFTTAMRLKTTSGYILVQSHTDRRSLGMKIA
jgi:hypothetical protein